MDEEIERLVIGVRADTASFARDVDAMRASLDGPLVSGADRAGRAIEGALAKALRTGCSASRICARSRWRCCPTSPRRCCAAA